MGDRWFADGRGGVVIAAPTPEDDGTGHVVHRFIVAHDPDRDGSSHSSFPITLPFTFAFHANV
jgi:hypothetical protein